jgi:hypothetical protein
MVSGLRRQNKIGKWLGPATGVGGWDCYWVLPISSQPIARSTVWSITDEEHTVEAIKDSIKALNLAITKRIEDQLNNEGVAAGLGGEIPPNGDDYFDDEDDDVIEEESVRPEEDDFTPEVFDGYLTASVMLPRGGEVLKAQVVAWTRDAKGNPIVRTLTLSSTPGFMRSTLRMERGSITRQTLLPRTCTRRLALRATNICCCLRLLIMRRTGGQY